MAPNGPKAAHAAPDRAAASSDEHPPVKGPHPGYISASNQFTWEQKLRRQQKENHCDPSREDSYRLQGVQLIENVREALQLYGWLPPCSVSGTS
jgi:CTD kinase subunit beta